LVTPIIIIIIIISKRGFRVKSYGTGKKIKIPGPSIDRPNTYDFGVATYYDILQDLRKQDERMYVWVVIAYYLLLPLIIGVHVWLYK
jgi:hypothetical protein